MRENTNSCVEKIVKIVKVQKVYSSLKEIKICEVLSCVDFYQSICKIMWPSSFVVKYTFALF